MKIRSRPEQIDTVVDEDTKQRIESDMLENSAKPRSYFQEKYNVHIDSISRVQNRLAKKNEKYAAAIQVKRGRGRPSRLKLALLTGSEDIESPPELSEKATAELKDALLKNQDKARAYFIDRFGVPLDVLIEVQKKLAAENSNYTPRGRGRAPSAPKPALSSSQVADLRKALLENQDKPRAYFVERFNIRLDVLTELQYQLAQENPSYAPRGRGRPSALFKRVLTDEEAQELEDSLLANRDKPHGFFINHFQLTRAQLHEAQEKLSQKNSKYHPRKRGRPRGPLSSLRALTTTQRNATGAEKSSTQRSKPVESQPERSKISKHNLRNLKAKAEGDEDDASDERGRKPKRNRMQKNSLMLDATSLESLRQEILKNPALPIEYFSQRFEVKDNIIRYQKSPVQNQRPEHGQSRIPGRPSKIHPDLLKQLHEEIRKSPNRPNDYFADKFNIDITLVPYQRVKAVEKHTTGDAVEY